MQDNKRLVNWGIFSLIIVFFFTTACTTQKKADPLKPSTKTYCIFKSRHAQRSYLKAYNIALNKLWPVPYEEKDIKTTYGIAHVIISGPEKGKPLVMLHGMDASSTMWYPNIKDFAQHYRVYCIDFILEPGKSVSYEEFGKMEDVVKWYDEVFDALKINHFDIIGASRGGWLAVYLTMHAKHKIDKIALLSPAQTFTWIKPRKQILANIFFTMFPRRPDLRNVLKTLTFNVDQINQQYINQYFIAVAKVKTKCHKSLLTVRPFSEDELKSLKIPVLVLIGDNDIINDKNGLQKAKDFIPNIEAETVTDASHFLSFDRPQEVDKRILKFLE
ncbi:MAG TPA: alpha/beta hydrolase [Bacteroidia bacterium]|jgi:pimeloyl-ACP methyl ester carboxylesterase|nr:alpha/beta hydrolase [Bacteroidia bacterium]